MRVLVLTMFDTDTEADTARAVAAGATGNPLKAERPERLFSAPRRRGRPHRAVGVGHPSDDLPPACSGEHPHRP